MKHKMRKLYLTFIVIVALLQTSCNNRSDVFKALQRADSLLVANNDSTAAVIFYQIPVPADTTDETALYNYVCAKINARNYEPQPPELLDLPIEYFKKTGDLHHLAYAYNYKSKFLLSYSRDISNAYIYNKEAEEIADNIDDDILKYGVYSNGYYISTLHNDTDECLQYAVKGYQIGEKLHDKSSMAYPALYLTLCYDEKNAADSAQKYMAVCLNYIDCYDMGSKAAVYTAFGNAMRKKNPVFAEQYYLQSLDVINNADAFKGLAHLYLEQGNLDKAAECYPKALRKDYHEGNVKLMSLYAQSLENAGRLAEAFQIYKDLSAEKDLNFQTKESNLALRWENLNNLYHTQKRDFKELEAKLQWFKAMTAALATLALSALVLLYIKTRKPAEKTVSKAEELYQRLANNECIAQWSKDERDIVAEYYLSQNADFEREIYDNYKKLPTNSIILLILQNIGKSKTEIMDIMGFSDQAYRSLKSRTDRAKK